MKKTVVIAIGGNSIIRPGERGTIAQQWAAADETCRHIASIIRDGWRVIITHGNGPQIGNILLRSEIASSQLPTLPLDVCGADSQGAMGYMIQQLLDRELKKAGINDRKVVTVVTQVIVDMKDPAFKNPSKPIGPFYTREEASKHRIEDHWDIIEDASRGYRRVVASPLPLRIVEEEAIKYLVEGGYTVITAGGGGLPVSLEADGSFKGQSAVIDKDRASSLLASSIKADVLLISTAVPKVCINFKKPEQKELDTMTTAEAEKYSREGHFIRGSMLPKIEASISFIKNGGKRAVITTPEKMREALQGNAGTQIIP